MRNYLASNWFWVLVLLAVMTALFYPFFSSTTTFLSSDLVNFFYPLVKYAVGHGFGPLAHYGWLPGLNCGTSILNTQGFVLVFSPFMYLFDVLGFDLAFNLFVIAQVLLTGLFCYFYFELILRCKPSAVLASLVFIFSGAVVARIYAGHFNILMAIPLLPLSLYWLEKFLQRRNCRSLVLLALFAVPFIYSGHPQMVFLIAVFDLLYVGMRLGNQVMAGEKGKELLRLGGGLALAALLCLGAAWYRVQTYQGNLLDQKVFAFGDRTASLIVNNPLDTIGLFFANHAGSPEELSLLHRVTNRYWESYSYIGIIIFVLALYSLLYQRNRYVTAAALPLIWCLVMGVADYSSLFVYLSRIPFLEHIRNFARCNILTAFALVLAAAFSVRDLLAGRLQWKKMLLPVMVTGGLALAYCIFVAARADQGYAFFRCFASSMRGRLLYVWFFLAVFLLLLMVKRRGWLWYGMVAMLLLEPLFINSRLLVPVPYAELPLTRHYAAAGRRVAYLKDRADPELYTYSLLLGEGVETIGGYTDGIMTEKYYNFLQALDSEAPYVSQQPLHATSRLFDVLGADIVIARHPRSDDKLKLMAGNTALIADRYLGFTVRPDGYTYENTRAYPRLAVIDRFTYEPDPARILAGLQASGADYYLAKDVVLETAPDPLAYEITSIEWGEQNRTLEIVLTTNKAALCYLAQSYDENWTARVNGAPAEIIPANYLFMAVPVAPGENRIRFTLTNPYGQAARVSLTAIVLLFLLALLPFRDSRPVVCCSGNGCGSRWCAALLVGICLLTIAWPRAARDFAATLRTPPFTVAELRELQSGYAAVGAWTRYAMIEGNIYKFGGQPCNE